MKGNIFSAIAFGICLAISLVSFRDGNFEAGLINLGLSLLNGGLMVTSIERL